jgi:hypothetical protein
LGVPTSNCRWSRHVCDALYSKTLEKLVVRYLIATNTGEIADELRKIVRSRVKR